MGRMVHDDVKLDVNGIPEELPGTFYLRMPLIKTEPDTYAHWKRRNGNPATLLRGTALEIKRLELDVGRLHWERKLRERPPISQTDLEMNKKIIEILGG